ncbi:MAG TPA: sigma-70 family RNA polymerase sigma factor [Gemmatales bacterium]|nr:sigma-70 family RNA polymerase sigma factor [Gemmatales bacterium]
MSRTIGTFNRFISWLRPESDESLLQRYIARNDEAAFGLLVNRYVNLVSSVCSKTLSRSVDVEDACQATFLILAQRAHAIRKQDALRSWLHGVAIRVSKTIQRRQVRMARRERENASLHIVASPAELLADTDLHDMIRHEVDRLPDQYRLPLQLCYWDGQSREQMAATLGWSTSQVKGQLERAKRRLKARLDQRGIQFLLPIGIGLTTIGLVTVLPTIALAATAARTTSQMMSYFMGIGSLFLRTFQATKGLGMLAIMAVAMGWMPPMPFLPIFQEEPQVQQAGELNDADPIEYDFEFDE